MIKKAIIPAAGLGTRFLPASKAQPKEMLTVVDKPTIQYVVGEAVEAGIEQILIITGRGKQAIENHFDRSYELEHELLKSGKTQSYDEIVRISNFAEIFYIRQKETNGLGGAILCGKHFVNNDPFAVLLGDSILMGNNCCTKELVESYDKFNKSVVGIEEVEREEVKHYGIIDGKKIGEDLYDVHSLIEKPTPEEAPSNLAISGRYILTPAIFDCLEKIERGKNGEYQLTDALQMLLKEEGIIARRYDGKRYDIGDKLGYVKANVELTLKRQEFRDDFKEYLKNLVKTF